MTAFRVVIPARYAASRLPAKPLCDIGGKPMIQHVYEQACKSDAISVVVATDDERIAKACEKFSAPTCMTSIEHLTGTDRVAEVVQLMNYDLNDIIVNVQGDQPLVPYENINQVSKSLMLDETANISTLCERIYEQSDLDNPAVVKVVFDLNYRALYFSRNLIPWVKEIDLRYQTYYKHIGLYAYRAKTIQNFVQLPPSTLELAESLEQLRFLANSEKIHVNIAVKNAPLEVNTPEDLEKIRLILQNHNGIHLN